MGDKARFIHELACALVNAAFEEDCWDSLPAEDFDRWLADAAWAVTVVEARQSRRKRLFSKRVAFDEAFRPRLSDGAIIAYPDAVYHVKAEDLARALEAAGPPLEPSAATPSEAYGPGTWRNCQVPNPPSPSKGQSIIMGRKKTPGVKRTASGRKSRAQDAYTENLEPILTRMRLFGLSEKDARDQKASTFIGRLQLTKAISQAQYDAAQEYLSAYEAFQRAVPIYAAMIRASLSKGEK